MAHTTNMMAILSLFVGFMFLIGTMVSLKKKRFWGMGANLTLVVLFLSLASLFGTISITTRGYTALTHEETAAFVKVKPTGPQEFIAWFQFVDGREVTFNLAGDELYVDAHIIKWKPIANFLGLHTAYELDRVSGRYVTLNDEKTNRRTVFTVSHAKPVDLFTLRKGYPLLGILLDAEYGSATFIMADKPEDLELRVSTTGLLIRRVKRDLRYNN